MKRITSLASGRHRRGPSQVCCAFISVVLTAVTAVSGFAQQVDGFAVRDPVITSEEMEHLIQALDLNEFQIAVVEGIVDAMRNWQREMDTEYRSRLKAQNEFEKDVKARIERAKEAGDLHGRGWLPSELAVTRTFLVWYDELLATARKKSDDVLAEIEAILDDRQRPGWVEFVRDRRRSRTLANGAAFAAERVDLKAMVVDDMDLAAEVRLSLVPLLSEYSQTIDPLLTRRNEMLREEHVLRRRQPSPEFEELSVRLRAGDISIDEYSTRWEALVAAELTAELERMRARYAIHESVRDATLAFYDAMLRRMPGEMVEPAQAAFEIAAYPDILSPLQTDSILEQALTLEDLSSGQRAVLEDFSNVQWKLTRRQIDMQLMRIRDEKDAAWRARRVGQEDPGIDARCDDLLRQRQSIQTNIIAQVREMLSTEQRALIAWPETIDQYPRVK